MKVHLNADSIYSSLLNNILQMGIDIDSRNSKTKRITNQMMTFKTTPLISLRTTAWKNSIKEMEWFLSGSSNINDLDPSVRHWWKPWANKNGNIRNNYSKQFRSFGKNKFDQIEYMIDTLINDPYSRRNVITTWHTGDMASKLTPLTNCHNSLTQVFVEPDNSVHMTMYQRSCDTILGLPHNLIAQWALLLYFAHRSNREVGSLTWIGGDCHIYEDHFELAKKIIDVGQTRTETPNLIYNPTSQEFKADDFTLDGEYIVKLKDKAKMIV